MHINGLLHRTFNKKSGMIDKRNHKTLLFAAETLCQNKHLSIAALGRSLKSKAKVKHNIKRMDRLFGNPRVQNARIHYCREVSHITLNNIERPAISIDCSGLTPCGEFHLLRASAPVKGRAMTIFEQSYRESEYMKQSIHESFLKTLQSILPQNCKPIVVTDAGFRNTWFQLILKFGWDFVGRVRHSTQYKIPNENSWNQ